MELVMTLVPEQLVAAHKTGFDTMFGFLTKALDGIEKLVRLNLQAFKSTLAENQEITVKAISSKDPQELLALQTSQVQPAMEKARSYWRDVYEIVSSTQAECAATAEAQLKQQQHDAQAFVDGLAKNAPSGSDTVFTAWKSTLETASATASSAHGAAKEVAKQAVDIAESNVSAAASASARSTKRAIGQLEGAKKKKAH
jgi:phasin family protein